MQYLKVTSTNCGAKMKRFWASWYSGYYEDEGCTKPPFEVWVTGQRERPQYGLTPEKYAEYDLIEDEEAGWAFLDEHGKNDATICAFIDAESEGALWLIVAKHFPDWKYRFCEEKEPDFRPGNRFQ